MAAGAEAARAYITVVAQMPNVQQDIQKAISKNVDGRRIGHGVGDGFAKGFVAKAAAAGAGLVKIVAGAVGVSGGLLAGLAAKGGLDRSLNIQAAQAKLQGLGHDATSLTEIMSNATASVRGTAFGLDEAATVAASAVAAGIQPGKDLTRYLSLAADAASIAGGSFGDLGSIFGDVAASGKVTGDVVNQLRDRGIPILQLLGDQMGVTAGDVSNMVSKGQVDLATFENAIEKGMGGAALKSGDTAAGAFANVRAALSRLGQKFTDPLVQAAPKLFKSIGGAVDSAGVAIQPLAEKFSAWLVPAIARLAAWINTIDFTQVAANIRSFFSTAQANIGKFFASLKTGDTGRLTNGFAAIGNAVGGLHPVFVAVAQGLGSISGSIGGVIGAGINLLPPIVDALAGGFKFLADNSGLLVPLILAIAAGMLIYKASVTASNFAAIASIPIRIGEIAGNFALAGAIKASTFSTAANTAATKTNVFSLLASKTASFAVRGATAAAAAAQWLFNAAMSANPIALIVLAIAALVAGLVWFFTQTDLGRQIWAGFTKFLGDAWNSLWNSVLKPVFDFIGAAFGWLWNSVILPVAGFIGAVIKGLGDIFGWLWVNAIKPAFDAIGAVFGWIWNVIIKPIIDFIGGAIKGLGDVFGWLWNTILKPVFDAIGAVFKWVWDTFIKPIVDSIVFAINHWGEIMDWVWKTYIKPVADFISDAFNNVGKTISDVFGGIGDFMQGVFSTVLDVVRGPINSIIDLINGVIDGLNSVSVTIPDWVPGLGGQTFGVDIPNIPRLADGGIVPSTPGGTLAVIGEGRYSEAVVPLSPQVMSLLGGGGARSVTVPVTINHPDPRIAIRMAGVEAKKAFAAA